MRGEPLSHEDLGPAAPSLREGRVIRTLPTLRASRSRACPAASALGAELPLPRPQCPLDLMRGSGALWAGTVPPGRPERTEEVTAPACPWLGGHAEAPGLRTRNAVRLCLPEGTGRAAPGPLRRGRPDLEPCARSAGGAQAGLGPTPQVGGWVRALGLRLPGPHFRRPLYFSPGASPVTPSSCSSLWFARLHRCTPTSRAGAPQGFACGRAPGPSAGAQRLRYPSPQEPQGGHWAFENTWG